MCCQTCRIVKGKNYECVGFYLWGKCEEIESHECPWSPGSRCSSHMETLSSSNFYCLRSFHLLLIIYLKDETEPERELVSTVHSPNTCSIWGWARYKSGAKNSVEVSHLCNRNSTAWVITCCLLECVSARRLDQKWNWALNIGIQHRVHAF